MRSAHNAALVSYPVGLDAVLGLYHIKTPEFDMSGLLLDIICTTDAQFGAIAAAVAKQYPNTNTKVAAMYRATNCAPFSGGGIQHPRGFIAGRNRELRLLSVAV
jgi:hypothetical protein